MNRLQIANSSNAEEFNKATEPTAISELINLAGCINLLHNYSETRRDPLVQSLVTFLVVTSVSAAVEE